MENTSNEPQNGHSREPENNELAHYGDLLHKEARSLITKYLPDVAPRMPTEVIVSESFSGGKYLGEFRGKHYITLGLDTDVDPYSPYTDQDPNQVSLLKDRSEYSVETWRRIGTLVHELFHQFQAEKSNLDIFKRHSLELDTLNPNLTSQQELIELLRKSHFDTFDLRLNSSMFAAITEGTAVLGELFIMNKALDEAINNKEFDPAKRIRLSNKLDLKSIRNKKILSKVGWISSYEDGLSIARKLYKNFGLQNLTKIVTAIDLNRCTQIMHGSNLYDQIMSDPKELPGLENLEIPISN